MKRIGLGGVGVVAGALLAQGCFALDWDFNGAPGAGGSGGDAASSGSGSPSGSSSGAPLNENCWNGVDDDSDGRVDCGDGDCNNLYECVAAVPAGWYPFWVIETVYQDPNKTVCPDGPEATVWFAEPAKTTTCSTCTCSFGGATCSAPKFQCDYYNPSGCVGANVQYQSSTTNCYNLPSVPSGGNFGSCKITAPPVVLNAGTCSGTSSSVTGPAKFGKELHLCQVPGVHDGGCSFGDACAPKKPGSLSNARTCIVHAGGPICPKGWNKSTDYAFEDGADGRTCSNCGCNASTVTCSGGMVKIYVENGCGVLDKTLDTLNVCVNNVSTDASSGSADFVLGTPNAGTCTQATPSGSVQTIGEHTICCRD